MTISPKVGLSLLAAGLSAIVVPAAHARPAKAPPTAATETTTSFATMGDIPAPSKAELEAFRKATQALYTLKEQAFAQGAADPIVKRFYANNALSVTPEGKVEQGRAAFTETYNKIVPQYNVKVVPYNTYVNGSAGWDWATFYVTPKDSSSSEKPFSFAILFLWTKVSGRWVCAGDIYVLGSFQATQ
ncbi:ketosteroid isomerase-like protein [Novosphingobium sp. 1529]|uniref:DUF4440 domain-containing protein n=1 Tax=Novosphingobium sp. 1529 TaxID=3156424 RepID=UPI003390B109